MEFPEVPELRPDSGSFSFSVWYNTNNTATPQQMLGGNNANNGAQWAGFACLISQGRYPRFNISWGDPGLKYSLYQTNKPLSLNTWHHVVYIRDTSADSVMQVYVNGVKQKLFSGSTDVRAMFQTVNLNPPGAPQLPFKMGSQRGASGSHYFKGHMKKAVY